MGRGREPLGAGGSRLAPDGGRYSERPGERIWRRARVLRLVAAGRDRDAIMAEVEQAGDPPRGGPDVQGGHRQVGWGGRMGRGREDPKTCQ